MPKNSFTLILDGDPLPEKAEERFKIVPQGATEHGVR
jgi:hypothetical protein